MKRQIHLLRGGVLTLVLGFGLGNSEFGQNQTTSPAIATKPPAVGDLVVARLPYVVTAWEEAKIVSINGPHANIIWSENSERQEVDPVDLYQIPKYGAQVTVKAGDYVLAKRYPGTSWNTAQVTMVSPGVITVKYNDNFEEDNLPPEKIIAVLPAAAANMKAEAAKTDFLKKAQAHTPQVPPGYRPKVGEHILGVWRGVLDNWQSGKVKSINGDKVLIEWERSKPDKEAPELVAVNRIVPYPTAEKSPTPTVGDYLLIKSSEAACLLWCSWDYAQVSAVNGAEIEVKDENGKARTVKPGEFVVLK